MVGLEIVVWTEMMMSLVVEPGGLQNPGDNDDVSGPEHSTKHVTAAFASRCVLLICLRMFV